MFFNNFINSIIKSMMAVCAVTSGWSMNSNIPIIGDKVAEGMGNGAYTEKTLPINVDDTHIPLYKEKCSGNIGTKSTLQHGDGVNSSSEEKISDKVSINVSDNKIVKDVSADNVNLKITEEQERIEQTSSLANSIESATQGGNKIQDLDGNDEDRDTISGANIQAVNGKNQNIANAALGKESIQPEDNKELRKCVYPDGYVKISFPEEVTYDYRTEFASKCHIDSLYNPVDQIIHALKYTDASNFCQLIKLNWKIISGMRFAEFIQLSDCLFQKLDIWFEDQDDAFMELKQKIVCYADELSGDGKSQCKEASDKLRGGNDISKLKEALELLCGYIKISFPKEVTYDYRTEFASDCYIDSLDTPEDQIIYALNNSHASNFYQLIKLNWKIISNMELEVFAELSRCLYQELDIWFEDQDEVFVQLKQKILRYADELSGDGKSQCKEASDKLRGGNDISKLKDALKLLNDYIY